MDKYGHDFSELVKEARVVAGRTENVYLLERDAISLSGVRFLGCTLWTDFEANGAPDATMALAREALSDFKTIRVGDRPIKPVEIRQYCQASYQWLASMLNQPGPPTVVVTHTAPSTDASLIHPDHGRNALTPAFHNRFDQLLSDTVRLWIYGRTHHSCVPSVNGVTIATNQRGYPMESGTFRWAQTIDL